MQAFFSKTKVHVDNLMKDIAVADDKFKNFREELVNFRADLKDYYNYFVGQVEHVIKQIGDNQMYNC